MGRFQDTDYIIKYAKYLKERDIENIKIEAAGDGIKKESFLNQIKEYDLDKIINYHGYMDMKDIVKLINKSHIGFSPRTQDEISRTAFPVKIYEYLACGLPVIVSPVGECSHMVEANKCGFGIDLDIEKFHEMVERFKNEKKFYSEYAENAYKLSKEFNRDNIAEELYRILKLEFVKY